jgi:hypothetical protein
MRVYCCAFSVAVHLTCSDSEPLPWFRHTRGPTSSTGPFLDNHQYCAIHKDSEAECITNMVTGMDNDLPHLCRYGQVIEL